MAISPEELLLLETMLAEVREMRKEQVKQGKDIARLKVVASATGAVSGAITAVGAMLAKIKLGVGGG